MANNYTISVTQPPEGAMIIDPASLPVKADNVGDLVSVTFTPGVDTQITSVTGFPSGVNISGPNNQGEWVAVYNASSLPSIWSYYISAFFTAEDGTRTKTDRHDPEIDNTPPGPGS